MIRIHNIHRAVCDRCGWTASSGERWLLEADVANHERTCEGKQP